MIECPKCGFSQPSGPECPACGIVFAKLNPTTSPEQTEPQGDKDQHSWEGAWFPEEEEVRPTSPLRLVTLLLLLALATVGAYLEYSRHTEAFRIAENTVCGFQEIRLDLGADRGDELRVGYFFRGQARVRGTGGQGRFLFRVIGPTGEGTALVHLLRKQAEWRAIQVDFHGPRGRTRSLEVGRAQPSRRGATPQPKKQPEEPSEDESIDSGN